MSVTPAIPDLDHMVAERGVSSLGGLNFTAVRLEIKRVLRNRRTLFFIVVFPAVFFFLFGMGNKDARKAGPVALAYVMISMAVYPGSGVGISR